MRKSIIFIICIVFSICGVQAQSMYVSSMKGNVNVRTAPSTTAPKVGSISSADLVPCIEELNGWYKIDFNGKEAYVSQSVATTCDAVIPEEMFGKDIESSEPWDKIRHQGMIRLTKYDNNHVLISMEWMRVNLPAESLNYLATLKDGKVVATHLISYADESTPMSEIMESASALDKPIPVGYGEFNSSIYFNGAEFSEFD